MPAPAVSIIMPAFNRERYLAESIESVLNQTFSDPFARLATSRSFSDP